ncbi:MAG: DAK2 domain-containing protein [Lachnospiraceae bacterium]|nr:DAK2 domain-containing protein [Lachnospiraceae bacterium]
MPVNTIDSALLAKMFLAGAKTLDSKKEWINELNVFPVPDGDTGTNMTMTIMSAAKEVASLISDDMPTLCKAISGGSLRGARGNSGVILSQLLRGFTKVAKSVDVIDAAVIAEASQKAVETAYKAVMKPKEGTILTVAKGMSDKACELYEAGETDLEKMIGEIIAYGNEVLEKTPEMLPVLKQAGVVDSGGQGLMVVMSGAYDYFLGKEIDITVMESTVTPGVSKVDSYAESIETEDIKYGYCTEFIILLTKPFNIKTEMDFKAYLESIGDSIVLVADNDIVKVHVHTNDPGMAIQKALKFGDLSNMKIDNMRLEHHENLVRHGANGEPELIDGVEISAVAKLKPVEEPAAEPMEHKNDAFIAISVGEGIDEIFKSLGVDTVISGGQTMNPSTEDILNAIEKLNADNVFILPNNKNIILAANQARDLTEDKKVFVIPSKTIPQGIAALIGYTAGDDAQANSDAMCEELSKIKSGEVTYAVRDTTIDDKVIKSGDYMGIGDAGIMAVNKNLGKTVMELIGNMVDDDSELISIYYGEDISEKDATNLGKKISTKYPNIDVELQFGGQPIYYYIVSVE